MSKPRLYLLTIVSPSLQPEHAQIKEAVQYHSDGDFVEVFKQAATIPGAKSGGGDIPFTIAYLFSTTTPPSKMGFGLLDRDRHFLVEVGEANWDQGFSVARNWLERHRGSA